MKITLKESTMVRPKQETPRKRIWNSNLDLLVPAIHIQTVYFYKPPSGSSSTFFDPDVLKEALSQALVPFYPVAGRLGRDENGRPEIVCNAEGVLFVVAESGSAMDDEFGDFTPCTGMLQLVPSFDYSKEDESSFPLLALQITTFKCGGVCLGVGFHHTLVDGTSALHFINAWSDMARGLPIKISPFLDRTLLRARDPPTPKFHHIEYHPPLSMKNAIPPKSNQLPATSTNILRLTQDQLNTLKSNAKKDINSSNTKLSTYEILTAHIWRCVSRARGLADDQDTKLYIATDGRSRLRPPLPPGYFGNALFTTTSLFSYGEIQSTSLAYVAEKIHDALKRRDDEYLRSALDFLHTQSDLRPFMRGSNTFKCPNLNIPSWIRLPIHDADFGWGRPIFMGPARVAYEGMGYILPSPTADGSLSLVICLEAQQMQVFRELFYDF